MMVYSSATSVSPRCQAFPEVPETWQQVFVTANHIKPEWHIRMQAGFQEFNDSAISKTCNVPNEATVALSASRCTEPMPCSFRMRCTPRMV